MKKPGQVKALERLLDETRLLTHRLKLVLQQIHDQGESSPGRRGVLRSLDGGGPQTVPQLARARPVSRQHMQTHVNDLLREGLVEYAPNPAHKRSHLVRLTEKGRSLIRRMNRREAALLREHRVDLSEKRLLEAADALDSVRRSFESERWRRLLDRH